LLGRASRTICSSACWSPSLGHRQAPARAYPSLSGHGGVRSRVPQGSPCVCRLMTAARYWHQAAFVRPMSPQTSNHIPPRLQHPWLGNGSGMARFEPEHRGCWKRCSFLGEGHRLRYHGTPPLGSKKLSTETHLRVETLSETVLKLAHADQTPLPWSKAVCDGPLCLASVHSLFRAKLVSNLLPRGWWSSRACVPLHSRILHRCAGCVGAKLSPGCVIV